MARADKAAAVAELTDEFRSSSAALLTEYRGLTVAQLKELRRSLAGAARYAVVKNTLTRRAAREAGLPALEELLEGPSAIAFVRGDAVVAAKGIRDFARNNPALVIKGGLLEGRLLSADEVRRLADLESREVLLAKLAGAMKASLSQAVSLFAAPLSQAARVIAALEQQKAAEPAAAQTATPTAAPGPDTAEAAEPESATPSATPEPDTAAAAGPAAAAEAAAATEPAAATETAAEPTATAEAEPPAAES